MKILDSVFVYQMRDAEDLKWHCRTHSHGEGEYEVHYFLQGSGSFRAGNKVHPIGPGRVFLTCPGETHAIHADDPGSPMTYWAILFAIAQEEGELLSLLNDPSLAGRGLDVGTNYRFFFEQIRERSLSGDRFLKASAQHQFVSFLYLLPGGREHHVNGDERNVHIERALRVMQKGVFENLDLGEVAGKVGLEKSYFSRLFAGKMHCSPMRYYTRLRMEAASSFLISSNLPVYLLSEKLRFANEFHFSRVFKNFSGLSPIEYRKKYAQIV